MRRRSRGSSAASGDAIAKCDIPLDQTLREFARGLCKLAVGHRCKRCDIILDDGQVEAVGMPGYVPLECFDQGSVSRFKNEAIPVAVGLYITAAYWFTASTSFANPAVTIARALTKSFAGISPADVPMFIVAQLAGALAAFVLMRWFFSTASAHAPRWLWIGPKYE